MKKIILTLLILVLTFLAGFYFKDDILKIYNELNNKIEQFQRIDLNSLVKEIKKQFFLPSPLRVYNPESSVVLTKDKIVSETNIQRENNGLVSLSENKKLSAAALAKANDMFARQYFDHVSPSGVGPADLVESYGYDYILAGENLILGNFSSEKEMVDVWMASPGHRENILNARYSEIGVAAVKGVFEGHSVWIAVQEFGLPFSACPAPSQDLQDKINSYQTQLNQLLNLIDLKRAEIENTSPRNFRKYSELIEEYNQLVDTYKSLANEIKILVSDYNLQIDSFNNCLVGAK